MTRRSRSAFDLAVLSTPLSTDRNDRRDHFLLLAQVQAHYEMQDLLETSNRIAIANHVQLNEIDGVLRSVLTTQEKTNQILSQMQEEQQSHFSQVKRERALKEVLFKIETYMAECQASKDRLTTGLTAELMLKVVDQHNFGTQDLGELEDKRYYDSLLKSAKSVLITMSKEDNEQLEQFKALYGAYVRRMEEGPERAESAKPLPVWEETRPPKKPTLLSAPVCEIEQKPKTPDAPLSEKRPMPLQEAEERALADYLRNNQKKLPKLAVEIGDYIVFFIMNPWALWLYLLPNFRNLPRRRITEKHQKKYDEVRREFLNQEEVKKHVEQLHLSPKEKHEAAVRKWNAWEVEYKAWESSEAKRKAEHEAKIKAWESSEAKRKAEHEAKTIEVKQHNDMVKAKTEEYEKLFNNALAKMRQQINAFLDVHPAMHIFYKKVQKVERK